MTATQPAVRDPLAGVAPVSGPSPTPRNADHGGRVTGVLAPPPLQVPDTGTYARLFPQLPAYTADMEALVRLGMSGGPMDADPDGSPIPGSELGPIPAGFTYFGQFLDHNITFQADATFDLGNTPGRTTNFRSGRVSLEHVYGLGPETQAFEYYDQDRVGQFWIDPARPFDVPRNAQGTAIIPDPRNDNTVITIQVHLAFMRFHNAVVTRLATRELADQDLFATAHQQVVWHYQWLVLEEWLRLIADPQVYADVQEHGPQYYKPAYGTTLPVEFTCAAYRLHSLVLETYQLNDTTSGDLFGLRKPFTPLDEAQVIDWSYFFDFGDGKVARAKRFEAKVAHTFLNMPGPIDSPLEWPINIPPTQALRSIAVRNLLRGNAFGLPSGQSVAQLVGAPPLTQDQLGLTGSGLDEAPLWYYVLKEAELLAGGRTLGPTGSRIVAEVLFGLVRDDPSSYLNAAPPGWRPSLGSTPGLFTMQDLLRYAGLHA